MPNLFSTVIGKKRLINIYIKLTENLFKVLKKIFSKRKV